MARTLGAIEPRDDEFFMKIAVKEGTKGINKQYGGPFGAIIVKDGIIIGKSSDKTNKSALPTKHATILAIENACKFLNTRDLSGCKLYTTSELCLMCYGACLNANISEIVYADTEAVGYNYGEQRLGYITIPEYSISNYKSKELMFTYISGRN